MSGLVRGNVDWNTLMLVKASCELTDSGAGRKIMSSKSKTVSRICDHSNQGESLFLP